MVSEMTISAFLEEILFNEKELNKIKEATSKLPSDLKLCIRKTIINHKAEQLKQLIPKVQFILGRANQEEIFYKDKKVNDVPLELLAEIKEKEALLEIMAKRMNSVLKELRQLEE